MLRMEFIGSREIAPTHDDSVTLVKILYRHPQFLDPSINWTITENVSWGITFVFVIGGPDLAEHEIDYVNLAMGLVHRKCDGVTLFEESAADGLMESVGQMWFILNQLRTVHRVTEPIDHFEHFFDLRGLARAGKYTAQ
jgi:hypothetical protein